MHRILVTALLIFAPLAAPATTWHINAATGNDAAPAATAGLTPDTPFLTIQAAVARVQPGDTLLIAPGIYFEHVTIPATLRGTADAPITLRAATPGTSNPSPHSVIITGADIRIRKTKTTWELVDPATHLYRTHYQHPAAGWPARVLYDNTDLYPYATLDALNTFQTQNAPGPLHGYYYDETGKQLYLRLHPRHARRAAGAPDLNPASHIIAVAPPTGGGFEGTLISQPAHYNIGILGERPAHIRIEGFTFETPGVAGIYTEAPDVTITDNWFYGCRTAVSGNYQETPIDPAKGHAFKNLRHDPAILDHVAARVTLRRCFFTQYPIFEDIADCFARLPENIPAGRAGRAVRYGAMWHRKGAGQGLPSELFKYEIGIACRIGRDWTIEDSMIVNAFEGLSCHAVAGSKNLAVRRNLFARLADNAIETEDWSRGMTVTENLILDTLEPISWQPLRGLPWPTDIVITRNVIVNTPAHADYWKPVLSGRGVFKIGASASNWSALASMAGVPKSPVLGGRGIEISHNLVWFSGGRLFTLIGDRNVSIPEIRLHDNLFATDWLFDVTGNAKNEMTAGHFTLARNLAMPARSGVPGPGAIGAGNGGESVDNAAAAGVPGAAALDFRTGAGLAAARPGVPTPDLRKLLAFDFESGDLTTLRWPLGE
ncbi:hypothetical protein OpiT1DRAFT_03677 [Opitutaceae bacterium TAV1]|nr:hypothetical protein OpiT1DRAFT_03677 [Opitutaceae bacterium TAV1]